MGDHDEKETVCVTGGGGYLASWLVKLLLLRGYKVHGTVRDPDVLDFESLSEAIDGCTGVFHTACPVPYYSNALQVEMIRPAVEGTYNVLKACSKAKVKRVVMVSSVAAVFMKPNLTKDRILDETCWSDTEYCMKNDELEEFYSYAKTQAEIRAFEYAKENRLDLVTVCPALIIGPLLRPAMNIAKCVMLCMNVPCRISEECFARKLSNEKLLRLGWKYRALEESIVDSVEDFFEKGLLDRKA
ncbi:hypothetical protein Sjap_017382 [Stephania japonica]|uniref:NAD-dependent epimerase/dehydratase domain-containing protein n=1 Tax=Stephania japonica TaxID=461633 RepID=A0AAP0I622_9MAGN